MKEIIDFCITACSTLIFIGLFINFIGVFLSDFNVNIISNIISKIKSQYEKIPPNFLIISYIYLIGVCLYYEEYYGLSFLIFLIIFIEDHILNKVKELFPNDKLIPKLVEIFILIIIFFDLFCCAKWFLADLKQAEDTSEAELMIFFNKHNISSSDSTESDEHDSPLLKQDNSNEKNPSFNPEQQRKELPPEESDMTGEADSVDSNKPPKINVVEPPQVQPTISAHEPTQQQYQQNKPINFFK